MTISADPLALRVGTKKIQQSTRRPTRPNQGSLQAEVKSTADILWEDARRLAEESGGETPTDAAQMDDHDTWQVLETIAVGVPGLFEGLPPSAWTDPAALTDLFELRKRFTGLEHPELKIWATAQKKIAKLSPDPNITPANPKFDQMRRRLARSD